MAKRSIFRSVAAVLAFGMCMTGLAGCGSEKGQTGNRNRSGFLQTGSS